MTSEASWRIFTDIRAARAQLLQRQSLRDIELPPAHLARSEQIFGERLSSAAAVGHIIGSVRRDGDAALRHWNRVIDRHEPAQLQVPAAALQAALAQIPDQLRDALELAAARIRRFHEQQPRHSWLDGAGGLGQLVRPVDSVGVYVPGGTAALPSSLLMSAIPAQVAGVEDIVVCSPPGSGVGGIHAAILAAAAIVGLERVYCVGGAQAIAAMAYGTQTVPRVATIVGAGNLYVTLAKQQVYGDVGIDGLLGPTETMIIADDSAEPSLAAADILAQAEHDVLAAALLLTPDEGLARAVQAEIARQLPALARRDIIRASMRRRSGCIITRDLTQAFELANDYAPEHLCLLLEQPWAWLGQVRNAGGVFLGEHSYEVLGDYVAGPSHVMPTGGTARFASPLNLQHFMKVTSVIGLSRDTARGLGGAAAIIAQAESLDAHAAAARARGRT